MTPPDFIKKHVKRRLAGNANKIALELILTRLFSEVVTEYRFHPIRQWRFDFAVPSIKLAVEYNGHGSTGGGHIGRHASVTGMSGDCEKMNEAQRLGWRVVQFTALFFDAAKREKLKLSGPLETLMEFSRTEGHK